MILSSINFDNLNKSRLDGANAAWEAAKTENAGSTEEKSELNTKIAELEHEKNVLKSEIDLFAGNMANVLSTPNEPVEPTLEAIRDLIKQKSSFSDNNARTVKGKSQNALNRLSLLRLQIDFIGNILRLSKVLEQKLVEVTQQLEKQCELHTETLRRAKRLEEEKNSHKGRIELNN